MYALMEINYYATGKMITSLVIYIMGYTDEIL